MSMFHILGIELESGERVAADFHIRTTGMLSIGKPIEICDTRGEVWIQTFVDLYGEDRRICFRTKDLTYLTNMKLEDMVAQTQEAVSM